MVIGIDEVGDFSPTATKINYFVAVLIAQNKDQYLMKKNLFDEWELSIPAKYRTKDNEVKGQLLSEMYLESFYNEVFNRPPHTLCSAVGIIPAQTPQSDIDKIKDHFLGEIDKKISEFEKIGSTPILKDYRKIRAWYKNRNYNNILKILCTERILSLAFRVSLEWGQLSYLIDENDISNIENVRFLIDKDFIRAPNTVKIHNELFRQYFQSNGNDHYIPVIEGIWKDEEHPVWKVHKKIDGNRTSVKNAFRDRIHFVDSHSNWEVRMADILGTIIHRYQNYNRLKQLGAGLMSKHFSSKAENFEYIHIVTQ